MKNESITQMYLDNFDSEKVAKKLIHLVDEAKKKENPALEIGRALFAKNLQRRKELQEARADEIVRQGKELFEGN